MRIGNSGRRSTSVVVSAIVVAGSMLVTAPAGAKNPNGSGGGGSTAVHTGIDVSYPQCTAALPTGKAFAIVGVNGGLANDYNPCLSAEFSYAIHLTATTKQAVAQAYVNTGDPGNGVADWPSPNQLGSYGSTTTPVGTCAFASGTSGPGANSAACAYIYGWDMVQGIAYRTSTGGTANVVGDVAAFHAATGGELYVYPTWLDVETGNSWQSATKSNGLAMNVADLQGMVGSLRAASPLAGPAAQRIGIYSTSFQWTTITGDPGSSGGVLWTLPDWIPGASSQRGAAANCSLPAFTGGGVPVTQWFGSLDGDYSCIG
jgi:hypothetical protein